MNRYLQTIPIAEETVITKSCNRDDLTFEKFQKYLAIKEVHYNPDKFYENFKLITPDRKFNILAELLSDDNMESIKVAVFKGKDKTQFSKRNEYGGSCLLYSLDAVLNYCMALNDTYIDTSVRPRREKHLFDADAFREAWINAVVHNRWVDGIPPAIYWFDDRMEIISYGSIPSGMTEEDFLSGESHPVNKELMQIFLQCHIVEQTGHGVPIVVSKYGRNAYRFSKSMITVTIPFDRKGFGDKTEESDPKTDPKTDDDRILQILRDNPKITRSELAATLGISLTLVKYKLAKLRNEGKIEHVGPSKNGQWIVR